MNEITNDHLKYFLPYWFRNRDTTGLIRHWPHDGTYQTFAQFDLLLEVKSVLKRYERWTI